MQDSLKPQNNITEEATTWSCMQLFDASK